MNAFEMQPASVSLPCRILLREGPEILGVAVALGIRQAVVETRQDSAVGRAAVANIALEIGNYVRLVLSLPASDEHGERVLEMRARIHDVTQRGEDRFRLALVFRRPIFRQLGESGEGLARATAASQWKM